MSSLSHRPRRACARSASCAALLFLAATAASAQGAAEPPPILLEDISVTANRIEGPQAAVGSAVTSITGEELEKRQIRVVSDALREIPGVAVNRTGPAGALTQLRIRGSESNQTLVIVDGVRMNDPGGGAEFDSANLLNLEVERIDVLRGPQSALYGSDAIGGVVNIVTRKGEPGPTRFRANVEGGSFDTITGAASVSGGAEAYDYLVAGQGFRTRGVSIAGGTLNGSPFLPGPALTSDRDSYESGTGLAKVSVRPNEILEFSGVARYTEFDADRDGFDAAAGSPFTAAVESRDYEKGRQFYSRAQAKATLLDGAWDHLAGLSHTSSDRRSFDGDDVKTFASVGEMTRFDYQTNYRFATEGALPASHTLTFGADHTRDAVESFSGFRPDVTIDQHIDTAGLVGQHQIGLFDSLFVTGSLRHDFNDRFEDETTYRLASAYTFEETKTKIRASYGTGVKNPTTFELYGFSDNFRPNENLRPEKGEGWDVGFDQPLWGDRISVDATYFQQRVKDLISSLTSQDPDSGEFFSQPINLPGKSKIDGVELGLTVRPLAGLGIRAAYTLTDGEDAAGATLVRRPRHIGSVNFNYAFLEGRANANLGVVHNGRQKDNAFDAATFVRTPVTLKSYTLVNLAASYKVHPNAEIYGRIENLFDKDYEEVFTYNTPGRAAYGGVRVSF